ncbi:MAG: alpha/beta hydrolase [Deltaproteobacteria bacterium]|jgi:pimeloyl-ACP methyl ester carboxylesterase|nr:alpha/beta hydrolase [Deltaproteobacteria bacterium]
MPFAKIGNHGLYYEIIGQGHPLVMIRGVGSNVDHWYEQVPALSRKFQLLLFDNRGIARSSDTGGPFSTRDMAADTAALMDAVGIKKAHVLGYSMGGMIAQEMALNYPQKIAGLILVATDCGISLRIKAKTETARLFSEMIRLGTDEAKIAAAGCLFGKQTFESKPEVIQRYTEVSQRFPASQKILARQWAAVTQHDACKRLPHISSPTLAITGSEDVLIPPQNAAVLAERIPDAQMISIDGGGHLFLIEQPRQFNDAVIQFLTGLP